MTSIKNSTILITGAAGGIGTALINEFISLGVSKIYATALKLHDLDNLKLQFPEIISPIELDVTNQQSIENCAKICHDVNILINNAGVELKVPFISEKSLFAANLEMNVNYFGVVAMINNFLPHLRNNKNSAIVNILSLASCVSIKRLGNYCASKAACHVFTQSIRQELNEKNIKVFAVYPGYVNTAMVPEKTATKKTEPKEIAFNICKDVNLGVQDIFPDTVSAEYFTKNPIKINYFE